MIKMQRLALVAFCFSATYSPLSLADAQSGTATIPPSSSVGPIKNNFFLVMSDKEFRPFAEILIADKEGCTKLVFIGGSAKWSETTREIEYLSAKHAREMLKIRQDGCESGIEGAASAIGNKKDASGNVIGAFKHLPPIKALRAGDDILDPRVYERAKKLLPQATPQKPKN